MTSSEPSHDDRVPAIPEMRSSHDENDVSQPPGLVEKYDCLVISDLHLGSVVCQAQLLQEFLVWAVEHTDELVINGDIFDDLNFKRLTKSHFACLKVIRKHSDRDDLKLTWIRGNHDGPAEIVSHIVGVEILEEYVYANDDVELLILHGDQFDHIISQHQLLTSLACGLFYFIQRWFPHGASRWIRRMSKKFQRNSQLVQDQAIEYARSQGYRYVTCGHTHLSLVHQSEDQVSYFNTGTWTEHPPCPFVAVKGDRVWLDQWPGHLALGARASQEASENSHSQPRWNGHATPSQVSVDSNEPLQETASS